MQESNAFLILILYFLPCQIQSTWKGYYVRKYVFDYYVHKEDMKQLVKKNEEVRVQLKVEQEKEERERLLREEKELEVQYVNNENVLSYAFMQCKVAIWY